MPPLPRLAALKQPIDDVEKTPNVSPEETGLKDHPLPNRQPTILKVIIFSTLALLYLSLTTNKLDFPFPRPTPSPLPEFVIEGIKQCEIISRPPPHPTPFTSTREFSDRYVKGTKAVYIRNATLWTGEKDGEEILKGVGIWLEGGVIRKIILSENEVKDLKGNQVDVDEIDVGGSWVTPGIVDLHSHMGLDSAPALEGSDDTNSLKAAVLPWLRSMDGFNTHDLAFNLSIAGGITTFQVLPGSAGNIGGQAFAFKSRWTYENTPQSMQVDPPFIINPKGNGSWERTHAWRHIKHACGENPLRVYGNTRMDSAYDFRKAYTEGKKLKDEQDRWCQSPKTQTSPFPTSLEWEVLADVIRGNVKVNIHCYETTDLNALVRISNEFKFPIAAFHHAHETYLVPELLKQAWGPVTPAAAIFATNARYKREAYRGSEYAAKILSDAGIEVIMKSDHPVLDSRYLMYEAAQAHHYGLNFSLALASVTTKPAKVMGMDHRLGYIRSGYDADIVIWDSFPLSLGATPKQTYIDGIPQIINPHVVDKPEEAQQVSKAGEYDKEARDAVESRGDPDLWPKKSSKNIIFQGVKSLYHGPAVDLADVEDIEDMGENGVVVVQDGEIACIGRDCVVEKSLDFDVVDLKGGSIAPGLISVGSYLGVVDIIQEPSTWDGITYDPLSHPTKLIDGILVHAADGVQFGGKDQLLAYREGVTSAVVFPQSNSLIAGLSVQFSTSSPHPLSPHAILTSKGALHISIEDGSSEYSVSTKIGILRKLLKGEYGLDELTKTFKQIVNGSLRLVVQVGKADVMANLIKLKEEVAPNMKMTFLGAQESWIIAESLSNHSIGVIVPARSYPSSWSTRRILPGPPISQHTLASYLVSKGVLVGLSIDEEWQARNTRYEAAWVYASSPREVVGRKEALEMVSGNLEVLLGLDLEHSDERAGGWVAYEGDLLGFGGRVRAVAGGRGVVDLF